MAHERRSEFVLSTTISELILLLFFLLLLLFGYHYYQASERERVLMDQVKEGEEARAAVRVIRANLGTNPSPDDIKVLVSIDKAQALVAEALEKERLSKDRAAGMDAVLKKLREDASSLAKMTPEELDKQADAAACRQHGQDLAVRETELNDANRRNRELTGQLARCTGKGDQFAACWRGPPDSRIEYVFETRITSSGIVVTRRWPDSRAQEMERFAGARALVGRTVSIAEFNAATEELFRDSERKACRYFVVISGNRSEMNAVMFTTYQRIQDHFYHLNAVN